MFETSHNAFLLALRDSPNKRAIVNLLLEVEKSLALIPCKMKDSSWVVLKINLVLISDFFI